jgi:hypothetical protein
MDRFRPHHGLGLLSLPDGRHRAVSSRESMFPHCSGGSVRPRAFIRVTGFKPLLTIWVANAPALSGEEADWHARSAD